MGQTTFSGPIRAGNIPNTTGTTVGTNVKNVGYALMAQSSYIDIIGAASLNQVVATVPAYSQIVDVILTVTLPNNDDGSATVSIGTSSDATAFMPATAVTSTGTTHGSMSSSTSFNVGSTDLQVLVDFNPSVGDGNQGTAVVTVLYIQANALTA